jgi:hypothetical protein
MEHSSKLTIAYSKVVSSQIPVLLPQQCCRAIETGYFLSPILTNRVRGLVVPHPAW